MLPSFRACLVGVNALLIAGCASTPVPAPLPPDAGPPEIRAAELQTRCGSAADSMDCYSEALLDILHAEGVGTAMQTLEVLAARDELVHREGHMYAHHIGLAAAPSPALVNMTFRECRPSFQSGCYHGVIQSYFAELTGSGAAVDAEVINSLCAEYGESEGDRWLLFQCVHGLGHGLTMLHDFHLPSALEACDQLASEWNREGCYGGVFMESIVNATTPHHTVGRPDAGGHSHAHDGHGATAAATQLFPPLIPERPLYPCTELDDRYLTACYQMQTSAILFHNGSNLAATAEACDDAPERYRGDCYLSLGRDISALTLQNHAEAATACASGDPEYQVWCHIGYVKNLVDLSADPADALTYCQEVAGAALKRACYHAVGEEIWVLSDDLSRNESWCQLAEDRHRDDCRRGAGLVSWSEVSSP